MYTSIDSVYPVRIYGSERMNERTGENDGPNETGVKQRVNFSLKKQSVCCCCTRRE